MVSLRCINLELPMTEMGHFRQIDPLPTLSACPLRSDRIRTFAPQQFDAVCHSTKSLRDSGEVRPVLSTAATEAIVGGGKRPVWSIEQSSASSRILRFEHRTTHSLTSNKA